MNQYSDELFYAAAFHEFYAEECQLITLPCLALNTEEELDRDEDFRWSSADWYWTDLPWQNSEVQQLFTALNTEANRLDSDHWQSVYDSMMRSMVQIAKKLTSDLKQRKSTTGDFGVFVFADEHPDEIKILQQCMTKAQFKRRFPDLHMQLEEETAIASGSVEQKYKSYRENLYRHQDKLRSMGEAAVPLLLDCLSDPEQGCVAADLLGELSLRQDRIIKALRKQAIKPGHVRFHETTALMLLGDVDFVIKLAEKSDYRDVAVEGIKNSYSCAADNCCVPLPLDYEPIERLLKIKSCQRLVRQSYSSGGNCVIALPSREIGVESLDAAINGTKSKHRIIREHAVGCLGNRSLGKAAGKLAMPAIVSLFNDRCFNVRRLAILSLSYWKKAATPYIPQLKKLCRDPDLREWAKYCLSEI